MIETETESFASHVSCDSGWVGGEGEGVGGLLNLG
jgi:hypothetical protein